MAVWYAAHVPGGDGAPTPSLRVGPDLQPFNWKPPPERGPYIPLAPPPQRGPDDE